MATETFDGDDAVRYEKMLNAVFGYVIDFNDKDYGYSPEAKIRQLAKPCESQCSALSIILKIYLWTMTIGQGFRSLSNTLANLSTGQLKVSLGDDKVTGADGTLDVCHYARAPLENSGNMPNMDGRASLISRPSYIRVLRMSFSSGHCNVEEYSLTQSSLE